MYYFASDMHLGNGDPKESRRREMRLCRWLESAASDAEEIFLVGDVFDFWYEYRKVVPKGFTRLLATLAALTERGVKVSFLPGNHDMWVGDYLTRECGVTVHEEPLDITLSGLSLHIEHGDRACASHSIGTRAMNAFFRSPLARRCFLDLHPDLGVRFGQWWSSSSRKAKSLECPFLGEKDYMVMQARDILKERKVDCFIYGHNHYAGEYPLGNGSRAFFLGHWFSSSVFLALDPEGRLTLNQTDKQI